MSQQLPSLKAREVVRALLRAGFFIHHQKGSHVRLFHKSDSERKVTVPYHDRDVPKGTLYNILKQAKLSPEEFLNYL